MAGDQRGQIDPSGIDPRDAAFFLREDYFDVLAWLRDEDRSMSAPQGSRSSAATKTSGI